MKRAFILALLVFCLLGCKGVQVKYSVTTTDPVTQVTVTQLAEYSRSVWIEQNIEGFALGKDSETGALNIELIGQRSAATTMAEVLADIVKQLPGVQP